MALREILLAEFDHEMAATRRLMASVPGRTLGWKPHERVRTMGELMAHITEIAAWAPHILDTVRFDLEMAPPPSAPATSVGVLLEQFTATVRLARALVDRSDSELNAMWSLRQGGQEMFSLPRAAAFRTFIVGHVVHHRGQLSVYLRMNDVPVGPIYGPSGADIK
jgi:uncharacterized damage-inducible protein DinB